MNTTLRQILFCGATAASFLTGCAAGAPKGAETVAPGWDGRLDTSLRLGVYLASGPGEYSQAGFETMSRAEEAMKLLAPRIKWAWIDSSHPGTSRLEGWDLDSLGLSLRTDTALRDKPSKGLNRTETNLAAPTRSALQKVGVAYDQDFLIAIRPGGFRAEKDSSKSFQDQAWFGLFDLKVGRLLYSLQAPTEGKQSAEASAESDWARGIWAEFRKAIESLPRRLEKKK